MVISGLGLRTLAGGQELLSQRAQTTEGRRGRTFDCVTLCDGIPSSWKSSRIFITPSPRKWGRPCGALRFLPILRRGETTPARSSMLRARSLPWAITCPCTWARCRCRCERPSKLSAAARGRRDAERSLPRRDAPARHHVGGAGVCSGSKMDGEDTRKRRSRFLCGLAGPSRGCGRDLSGIDGPVPRDLSGRIPHSTGANHALGNDGPRCSGIAAEQRPHPQGARRRSGRADCSLPHRRRAAARSLRTLWAAAGADPRRETARLLGAGDARVLGACAEGNISSGRLHGQRRNQRPAGEDRRGHERSADTRSSRPRPHGHGGFHRLGSTG